MSQFYNGRDYIQYYFYGGDLNTLYSRMVLEIQSDPVSPPHRDTIHAVASSNDEDPTIVSISDIHGYLSEAKSALLSLSDHPEYNPVVTPDSDGLLHWANENYVLVFNGDLIDRGPDNEAVLAMVGRLIDEALPERVRVTLGNHESMILLSNDYQYVDWYSTTVDAESRKLFLETICDRYVTAAYQGYSYTYVHAGAPDEYDVATVNEQLIEAADQLYPVVGTMEDSRMQSRLATDYSLVLGKGNHHVKGPSAGLVWLDYDHLSKDSPPQIVGHTRHQQPQTKGAVHCQDILQDNLGSPGGEGVFVETPESLTVLIRESDSYVKTISIK